MRHRSATLRLYISILVILGMIFSGTNLICPKNGLATVTIEICSGHGGIKTVEVAASSIPKSIEKLHQSVHSDYAHHHHDHKTPAPNDLKCPYCVAAHTSKILPSATLMTAPHMALLDALDDHPDDLPVSFAQRDSYEARAPPVYL